ncbi:flavin-binding monooxygenase-like-domain-containing protein [Zopfochytrium polystomum]|nr:flavin-binding monooxygenase-like-domain-containing protein [Zopfochytrium polystomum]
MSSFLFGAARAGGGSASASNPASTSPSSAAAQAASSSPLPPAASSASPESPPKRVAIIGAGASGLTAIKECREMGLDVVCFEAEPHVGGLWRYVPVREATGEEAHSSLYQSTVINNSKDLNDLSLDARGKRGASPGASRGRSPARSPYYDESTLMTSPPVNGYEYVQPQSSASPIGSGGQLGDRSLSTDGLGKRPVLKSKAETFDFVIVASGHHWKPKLPEFEGMEKFKGNMLHSHSYRVPYPFKDARVLVVGVGNSGLDIAAELSHHARQVVLSSRSGAWVIPRFSLFGLPSDHLSSRAANALPRSITNLAIETLTRLQVGNLERFGLKPEHRVNDPSARGPSINSEILERIGAGKILVRPNLKRFTGPTSVEFEDGSTDEIDTIIYCTGYLIDHPFLDSSILQGTNPKPSTPVTPTTPSSSKGSLSAQHNKIRLYKHVLPINYRNIAFIGLVQPTGSIMPVSEMQSRWVSRVFAGAPGTPPLPSPAVMESEAIAAETAAADASSPAAQASESGRERQTIFVDYVAYMDEIASLVGCKPDLWKLWRNKWLLAAMVTFGPAVPAQYRLEGPGAWDGSESVINDACAGYDFRKVVGYQAAQRLRDDPTKMDD